MRTDSWLAGIPMSLTGGCKTAGQLCVEVDGSTTGTHRGVVYTTCRRLETQGLVFRKGEDTQLHLTVKGSRLADQVTRAWKEENVG